MARPDKPCAQIVDISDDARINVMVGQPSEEPPPSNYIPMDARMLEAKLAKRHNDERIDELLHVLCKRAGLRLSLRWVVSDLFVRHNARSTIPCTCDSWGALPPTGWSTVSQPQSRCTLCLTQIKHLFLWKRTRGFAHQPVRTHLHQLSCQETILLTRSKAC
jgi:hypothetical protein